MRVILQRVSSASVVVTDPNGSRRTTGAIDGPGLVALVGITHDDDVATARTLAEKTAGLRILSGGADRASGRDSGRDDIAGEHDADHGQSRPTDGTRTSEASCLELGAPVLAISQFTLYADCRKGRRPSWSNAAPGAVSEPLVDAYVQALRDLGLTVATGEFGADMQVSLVNDGPVTIVLDSHELSRPRRG